MYIAMEQGQLVLYKMLSKGRQLYAEKGPFHYFTVIYSS